MKTIHRSVGSRLSGGLGVPEMLCPSGPTGPSLMIPPGGAVIIRKGVARPISSPSFQGVSSLPPMGNPVSRFPSGHPTFVVTSQC